MAVTSSNSGFKRGPLQKADRKIRKQIPISKKQIQILDKKSVHKEMLFLGIVKSITLQEVAVSLTDCLTGYIKTDEFLNENLSIHNKIGNRAIFESLKHILLHKPLLCAIVRVREKPSPKIILTANPSKTNNRLKTSYLVKDTLIFSLITSVEENGFIVETGIKNIQNSFLKLKNNNKFYEYLGSTDKNNKLITNLNILRLPVWSKVRKMEEEGLILSFCSKFPKIKQIREFDDLQPGIAVEATVVDIFKNGAKVMFQNIFFGIIDEFNSEKPTSDYKTGDKLIAIIVLVDFKDKKIILSTKPHLAQPFSKNKFTKMVLKTKRGTDLKDAKVSLNSKTNGLFLKFEQEHKKAKKFINAFCHVTRFGNDIHSRKSVLGGYKTGKNIDCKIYDSSEICGLFLVTLAEQKNGDDIILSLDDLVVGQILTGKLLKFETYGMLMSLGTNSIDENKSVKGVVPNEHFSDVVLKRPKLKFEVGQKIKCRVLNIDILARKVYLTAKQSFIEWNSDIPLTEEEAVNKILIGCVRSIFERGIYVNFFNGLFGFLSKREISAAGFEEKPSKIFFVGQPLKVKADALAPIKRDRSGNIASENKRMLFLTLDFSDKISQNAKEMALPFGNAQKFVKIGEMCAGTIIALLKNKAILKIDIRNSDNKSDDTTVRGELYFSHLSDLDCCSDEKFEKGHKIKLGDVFRKMAVIGFKKNGAALLTNKKLLIDKLDTEYFPFHLENVKRNSIYIGTIKNIRQKGIVVGFLGDLNCFCPISMALEKEETNLDEKYKIGKTVFVRIANIDRDKIIGSLKQNSFRNHNISLTKWCFENLVEQFWQINIGRTNIKIGQVFEAKTKNWKDKNRLEIDVLSNENSELFDNKIKTYLLTNREKLTIENPKTIKVVFIDFEIPENKEQPIKANFLLKSKTENGANFKNFSTIHNNSFYSLIMDSSSDSTAFKIEKLLNVKFCKNNLNFAEKFQIGNVSVFCSRNSKKASDSDEEEDSDSDLLFGLYTKGEKVEGVVSNVSDNGLDVTLNRSSDIKAIIHFSQMAENFTVLLQFHDYLSDRSEKTNFRHKKGSKIEAKIIGKRGNKLLLTLLPEKLNSEKRKIGQKWIPGRVVNVSNNVWLNVEVGERKQGRVHITNIKRNWDDDPMAEFEKGQFVKLYRTNNFYKNESNFELFSLYCVDDILSENLKRQLTNEIKLNDIVKGYVKSVHPSKGVFVTLNPFQDALVYKKDLSDGFVTDIESKFPPGRLVRAKVIFSDGKYLRLSLKGSDTDPSLKNFADFCKDQVVSAKVVSATPAGVFAKLESSSIVALCRLDNLENNNNLSKSELTDFYKNKIGQSLKFRIGSLNSDSQKINLTMKIGKISQNSKTDSADNDKISGDDNKKDDDISDDGKDDDIEEKFLNDIEGVEALKIDNEDKSESELDENGENNEESGEQKGEKMVEEKTKEVEKMVEESP
ncbi:hypothetical protein MHBO_000372, partial [Bonamia ostreae]